MPLFGIFNSCGKSNLSQRLMSLPEGIFRTGSKEICRNRNARIQSLPHMPTISVRQGGEACVCRFLRHVRWRASQGFRFRKLFPLSGNKKGGIPYSGTLLLSLASEKEERE